MSALGRLVRLPSTDRSLLSAAILVLTMTRLAVRLFPVRAFTHIPRVAHYLADHRKGANVAAVDRICWAVERASRYIPGADCLTQALGAQLLLAWYGQEAALRLGVAREPARSIIGHAWLERDGVIILGTAGATRYLPLSARTRLGS